MNGLTSYILSKKYVESTADALGAVKGAPATIKSITEVDGGQKVTFEWTGTSGTKQTSEMTVKNGVSVTGISDKGNGVFTLLLSDGSESDPIQTIKGLKGDKGEKLTFNDLTETEKESLKGQDGFSPIAKVEKVGKVATITITDKDGTTTATVSDGSGSEGGEANLIDSISVNGVNVSPDVNKNVDITVPTKTSDLSNDSGFLTEHQDISGKVDKVDGKSLIADSEIERLASVDNYDDTQVKTAIQAVANGLMDSVGYSADYKTIDIIAKNGVKKSVNVAPIISHASITELSDVDTTNKATGKALVYNATTSKHEYADVSGTDEKVKMDASTDAKYLGELLDNITIANENGELKVKKLDGQEVTITEINYLKGLTMNVMDLVNMFSNGGVKIINTPVATYAELLTLDKSSFIEGISYLVYVLADENHDNAKTTYLVDKDSETPTYFGFADSQRDFTTNPIDLATEITGKLGISNMDSDAIKALFTVDDTYKTETATNNAFSTHGAKALYDELLLAIGNKANDSDLTAHKDDVNIHVSTTEKDNWNGKADASDLTAHTDDADIHVTTDDKTAWNKVTDKVDKIEGKGLSTNDYTNEDKALVDTIGDKVDNSDLSQLEFDKLGGGKNLWSIGDITVNGGDKKVIFDASFEENTQYTFSFTTKAFSNKDIGHFRMIYTDGTNTLVSFAETVGSSKNATSSSGKTLDYIDWYGWSDGETASFEKIQLEKGTTATPYEPYIPSVKMLAEENAQQNTEAIDLKMLGWTVPRECPIQNYVDGNGVFHQRIGRVDLGSLEWTYDTLWKATSGVSTIKNLTVNMYHSVYVPTIANVSDMPTNSVKKADSDTLWINNGSSTEKPSGYLYFELATEKTINVDGNEAVTKVNDSLDVIGKCKNLLKPTLQTTTNNGVTCTNNGDGTYTINGTASSDTYFTLEDISNFEDNIYKIVSLKNANSSLYSYINAKSLDGVTIYSILTDIDKPTGYISKNKYKSFDMGIAVMSGTTLTNEIVKPMLTTDLNATYDDFVPYTGDGETLTHDVAELNSNLDTLEYSDIAGGKNLANINDFKVLTSNPSRYGYEWLSMKGGTYTFNITNGKHRLYIGYKHNGEFVNPSSVINGSKVQTITISDGDDIVIWYDEGVTEDTVTRLQLEEGSVATSYEPYIPSVKMLADKIYNNTKVDIVLYDKFDTKVDNIQNRLYLLGDILYGSLYIRFDEEHDPFTQGFDWVDIGDVPQIVGAPQLYNCISYAEILDDNDYAKGDVRIYEGKLGVRIRKQPTVSRANWYIFYNAVCMKVELA